MRGMILSLLLLSGVAAADTTVCVSGRCRNQTVTVVSAQEHADQLAVTNTFVHCGRRGGGYEGLGFSTASPDAAVRRSCFYGQRRVREVGTAWCPARRGWVAVVRYE
jgi:hypothetical protein